MHHGSFFLNLAEEFWCINQTTLQASAKSSQFALSGYCISARQNVTTNGGPITQFGVMSCFVMALMNCVSSMLHVKCISIDSFTGET